MLKLNNADELLKECINSRIANSKVDSNKHIIVARLKPRLKMASVFKLVHMDGVYLWVDLLYSGAKRNRSSRNDCLYLEEYKFEHNSIEDAVYQASSSSKVEEVLLFEGSREFFNYLNNLDEQYSF